MRRRIAVGHPTIGRGGSESRVMWLLQTLKDAYDVTLVTTRDVDLVDLNHFYGTAVGRNEITIRCAPVPWFMKNSSGIAGLRGVLYERFTQRIGHEYDLCISAYNLTDWGAPALHFIADFVWDRELVKIFDPTPRQGAKLIHQDNFLRRAYLQLCRLIRKNGKPIASFFDGTHQLIANSQWSSDQIENKYGYVCDAVVFPPVLSAFRPVKWKEREYGFVSIGRVAQEKRVEQQIDIMERVRALGHNLHFHIIGEVENDPYGNMIKEKCAGKPWVHLEGRKVGLEKERLLTKHKFALHTRPHEAFGITVAEYVKAGCIPFLPDSGGQVEVAPFNELQFGSVEDAVLKIDKILRSETLQQTLLQKLETQKNTFSSDRFCSQARQIVDEWFASPRC